MAEVYRLAAPEKAVVLAVEAQVPHCLVALEPSVDGVVSAAAAVVALMG